MKRYIICSLLMLSCLLNFASISLAEEGKWTKKADMPTKRGSLSTSVVNGKIYAIGGTLATQGGAPLGTVEEYDPKTDKWTKKADMPTKRWYLSTSVVNDKIYAIGGSDGAPLSTVEEYDPKTDKWTKKADLPFKRAGLSSSEVNGKIYAIGGLSPLPTVDEYDPATDKWTKKANMPTARWLLATSVVGGKIYAIGGLLIHLGPAFSTVEEFDPLLAAERVEPKEKLVIYWGRIKKIDEAMRR